MKRGVKMMKMTTMMMKTMKINLMKIA